jgi:hypothetical protein
MENIEQEEPKQIKCYCGHTTYCDCGPLEVSEEAKQRAKNYMSLKGALESKQETLEEAAERYSDFSNDHVPICFGDKFNPTSKADFIAGAKWQAERMYSEEDMEKAFYEGLRKAYSSKKHSTCWKEWFEQFKKK